MHGFILRQQLRRRKDGPVRHGQRGDVPDCLAHDAQRFAARRQDLHVGIGAQEPLSQNRAGVQEMLAGVQHQEQLLGAQRLHQHGQQRTARGFRQAERHGDRVRDQRGV